jgi:hypothetical protein
MPPDALKKKKLLKHRGESEWASRDFRLARIELFKLCGSLPSFPPVLPESFLQTAEEGKGPGEG